MGYFPSLGNFNGNHAHYQVGSIIHAVKTSKEYEALITTDPRHDDKTYISQRPLITDANKFNSTTLPNESMDRIWGVCKNLFLTSGNDLLDMEVGRIINGEQYLSIGGSNTLFASGNSDIHVLVLHTESI